MLGKEIRGIRHLFRYCKEKPTKLFITFEGSNRINDAMGITVNGSLFILNNDMRNVKGSCSGIVGDLMTRNNFGYALEYTESSLLRRDDGYRNVVKQIIALPDDFNDSYINFLNTNKKMVQPLESKMGHGGLNADWCRYIYMMTGNSKNFYSWAILSRLRGTSLYTIIEALRWNDNYQQLAKNLKKGTITAYTNLFDIISLLDEQRALRRMKRVNDTINMFNTKQKKILREYVNNENAYQVMSRFRRLTETKQNNFIRKMSTVDDPAEIMKQMAFVSDSHFSWSKKDFIDYLNNNENLSFKLIVDKGQVVLVEVKDFDTVKRLAKNTNWCISKNKQYWNNYMSAAHIESGTKQYVLFDFDKKEDDVRSIVGFTINNKKGITASHDYVNNNILDNKINMTQYFRKKFHTLVPSKESTGGIHALLSSKGIDVSSLIPDDKIPYLWNINDFIKFVNKQIGDENSYDILFMQDNMLVLLIENINVKNIFGGTYVTKVPRDLWDKEHIIFANFNADPTDPDRLYFGIIEYDNHTKEAYCSTMLNASCDSATVSFDEMLSEYGLPYDIICRSDVLSDKVFSALTNYDLESLKTLLSDSKSNGLTFNGEDAYEILEAIRKTLLVFLTDEFIKVIYDTGHTIGNLIGNDSVYDIVSRIHQHINNLYDDDITDDEFKQVFNRETTMKTSRAEYVALCYLFKLIYDNENAQVKKQIDKFLTTSKCRSKFIRRITNYVEPVKSKSSNKYVKITPPNINLF